MSQIEKTISNLIEKQFPSVFVEEGPVLVEFVKTYYEWMETREGPLYHSRRLLDYRDLDTTIDEFLIHFKNKYLSGIQLDTAVETKQVIKHALDMYRSKGTERSIDLFFRNLFGVSTDIYYPGDDIFRTSDGIWVVPRYLEVEVSENLDAFIGLQIEGIESGATAYVEKYIKKRHKGTSRYAHIYYINRPVGNFIRGERIRASKSGLIGPVVLGSLNELTVISSSSGYNVGDIVDITSFRDGIDGKARVSAVLSTTGKINFKLDQGGWGYKEDSQVIISEKVLTINSASYSGNNFSLFETVVQPKSTVTFNNLSGTLNIGDSVFRIDNSDGTVYSAGIITGIDLSSNQAVISVTAGQTDNLSDLEDEAGNIIYTESGLPLSLDGIEISNSHIEIFADLGRPVALDDYDNLDPSDMLAEANVVIWNDTSATANLMAYSANLNLIITANSVVRFANGDNVYQESGGIEIANGFVLTVSEVPGGTLAMRVLDSHGTFMTGLPILSRTSAASGTVEDVSTTIGVFDINGDFTDTVGNFVYTSESDITGTISRVSRGTGAEFVISNTFNYVETVSINTDGIINYVDVELDAPDYGMPAPGVENQNTILSDAMTFAVANVGKITSIIIKNEGSDYDTAPYVLIYEPLLAGENRKDVILQIENPTGAFTVGEPILQNGIQRGLVKPGSNSTYLFLERISLTDFVANAQISGVFSGFTANVLSVDVDYDSSPVGLNASIISNTAVGSGVVSSLEIIDSGFNYLDYETVTFSKPGLGAGTAEARLLHQGFSEGYYKQNRSVLSGDKYLQDGDYYQEYSYEIRSPVPLEKYRDILRNIVHMAGTKHFSRYQLRSGNDIPATVVSSVDVGPIEE